MDAGAELAMPPPAVSAGMTPEFTTTERPQAIRVASGDGDDTLSVSVWGCDDVSLPRMDQQPISEDFEGRHGGSQNGSSMSRIEAKTDPDTDMLTDLAPSGTTNDISSHTAAQPQETLEEDPSDAQKDVAQRIEFEEPTGVQDINEVAESDSLINGAHTTGVEQAAAELAIVTEPQTSIDVASEDINQSSELVSSSNAARTAKSKPKAPQSSTAVQTPEEDDKMESTSGLAIDRESLRPVAKMGAKLSGSGDGLERGEECFQWTDLAMNKQGFRYVPCGPSPNVSPDPFFHPFYRTIPSQTLPLSPNPGCPVYSQVQVPPRPPSSLPETFAASPDHHYPVHLDWYDRSAYLRVSESALTCTADKGFRSARGNVSVREGAYYFEVLILKGGGEGGSRQVVRSGKVLGEDEGDFAPARTSDGRPIKRQRLSGDGAHVRIGWARREATLNGPVGLDGYSYGIRDSTGEKVTLSRPRPYGQPFGTGDVVGCLIDIPTASELEREEQQRQRERDPNDPSRISRKRVAVRYKGQLYFESVDGTTSKELDGLVMRDGRTDPVAMHIANGHPPPEEIQHVREDPQPSRSQKGIKRAGKKGKPGIDDSKPAVPPRHALPVLKGSSVSFFLNGKPMSDSPAFRDLFDFRPLRRLASELAQQNMFRKMAPAEAIMKQRENHFDDGSLGYYPMVSCFGGGKAQFNPGPTWYRPVDSQEWGLGSVVGDDGTETARAPRPLSERWQEWKAEEAIDDEDEESRLTEELRRTKRQREEGEAVFATKISKGKKKGRTIKRDHSRTPLESTPVPEAEEIDSIRSSPQAFEAAAGEEIPDSTNMKIEVME